MRERVDAFGVAEPEIARSGKDQIEVDLPGVKDAERAASAGRHDGPAVLLRLGEERPRRELQAQRRPRSTAASRPITGLYNAVKRASKCEIAAPKNSQAADRSALLRLRQGHQEAVQRRAARRLARGRARQPRRRRQASRAEVIKVHPGRARPARREGAGQASRRRTAGGSSTTTPALSGTDIKNPEQNFDQRGGNEPIVTFDFTDKGRKAFQDDHARDRPARRRQRAPGATRTRSRLAALRDRARQRARLDRRTSTSARTPTASTARPARRSRAASRSRAPRTWRSCSRSARCRSSSS